MRFAGVFLGINIYEDNTWPSLFTISPKLEISRVCSFVHSTTGTTNDDNGFNIEPGALDNQVNHTSSFVPKLILYFNLVKVIVTNVDFRSMSFT